MKKTIKHRHLGGGICAQCQTLYGASVSEQLACHIPQHILAALWHTRRGHLSSVCYPRHIDGKIGGGGGDGERRWRTVDAWRSENIAAALREERSASAISWNRVGIWVAWLRGGAFRMVPHNRKAFVPRLYRLRHFNQAALSYNLCLLLFSRVTAINAIFDAC